MIAKQKLVQALIQTIIEADRDFQRGNDKLQTAKVNFLALGIDLTDTNLTTAQVTAINGYANDAQALVDSPIVAAAKSKDIPSHSSGALK